MAEEEKKEAESFQEEVKAVEEAEKPEEKPEEETKEEVKEEPKPEPKPEPEPEPKVKDKVEEKEVEVPKKFKKLVEEIEEMSIMELAELVKILEKKFGVSPIMAAPAAAGAPTNSGGEVEEKTEFNIELKDGGSQKIQVIKVVREITGKGLKEAKDIVDAAPKVIKENVKKEEAEELKKKLEVAGASVELK